MRFDIKWLMSEDTYLIQPNIAMIVSFFALLMIIITSYRMIKNDKIYIDFMLMNIGSHIVLIPYLSLLLIYSKWLNNPTQITLILLGFLVFGLTFLSIQPRIIRLFGLIALFTLIVTVSLATTATYFLSI